MWDLLVQTFEAVKQVPATVVDLAGGPRGAIALILGVAAVALGVISRLPR
ncbi:hypothetical protein [Micromonospora sp. NPDC049645]